MTLSHLLPAKYAKFLSYSHWKLGFAIALVAQYYIIKHYIFGREVYLPPIILFAWIAYCMSSILIFTIDKKYVGKKRVLILLVIIFISLILETIFFYFGNKLI